MNATSNLIPTPKYFSYDTGKALDVSHIFINCPLDGPVGEAIKILTEKAPVSVTNKEVAELIVVQGNEEELQEFLPEEDLSFFGEKYADEQGYIIKKEKDGQLIVGAKTNLGCAYGVLTLLQLLGQEIDNFTLRDWPDFKSRGNRWLLWAESGIWTVDFGDGIEAMKQRILRLLNLSFLYKINAVYFDGFGLNLDRFPEYVDVMRFSNDQARRRGISLFTGTYGMSYGAQCYGAYQGKAYLNKTTYPDGEVYHCIGSYQAHDVDFDKHIVDRSKRSIEVRAREHGTCLSNEDLFELKAREMEEYLKKTHCGGFYLHNMDSFELHPELWQARCDECRKRWPNDDLLAEDGAAGGFAYFFDKLAARLSLVKDGDYDAARDFHMMLISPGYTYQRLTTDEDFGLAVSFWAKVSQLMKSKNVSAGFRETFFNHNDNNLRVETVLQKDFAGETSIINFCGADGFYNDDLFIATSAFNYLMKGYDRIITANGNVFQEALQVFNAEYLWCCENSGFYNQANPHNHEAWIRDYYDMLEGRVRPEPVYKEGGMLDVICEKLYGASCGKRLAEMNRLTGKNGEAPIPSACNRNIYTNYNRYVLPMRWDDETMEQNQIAEMLERFSESQKVTERALTLVIESLADDELNEADKSYFEDLRECFTMGACLCALLADYMTIYQKLDGAFAEKTDMVCIEKEIEALRLRIADFSAYVQEHMGTPKDIFGGVMARREELAEFLDYQTELMLQSIRTKSRIPADRKPLLTRDWW